MSRDGERAWIEIRVDAVRRNAETLARHSGAKLLPMVKADGYGLGVGPVLRALEPLDPWGYGVATVAEGEELRALGITRPVLVLTPVLIAEQRRARAAGLTLALGDADGIAAWTATGGEWHLSVDTGMARGGVDWRDVSELRELIVQHPPAGVLTHFHSAEYDPASIAEQEARFAEVLRSLPSAPPLIHTDNSAAIVRRQNSALPLVRPGIFMYGAGTFAGTPLRPEPVVSVRARIVDVRSLRQGDTVSYGATYRAAEARVVATVPYGHADGYPIACSGNGLALLHGQEVRVVGRVTMDMTMLDVTGVSCRRGDAVTFVGSDGDRSLTVDDVTSRAGVSPYEFLVRMRNRIPRFYSGE